MSKDETEIDRGTKREERGRRKYRIMIQPMNANRGNLEKMSNNVLRQKNVFKSKIFFLNRHYSQPQ